MNYGVLCPRKFFFILSNGQRRRKGWQKFFRDYYRACIYFQRVVINSTSWHLREIKMPLWMTKRIDYHCTIYDNDWSNYDLQILPVNITNDPANNRANNHTITVSNKDRICVAQFLPKFSKTDFLTSQKIIKNSLKQKIVEPVLSHICL